MVSVLAARQATAESVKIARTCANMEDLVAGNRFVFIESAKL